MTTAAEIRELWDAGAAEGPRREAPVDPEQGRLLDAMSSRVPMPLLELTRRSGLDPDRVSALLGLLELDGVARREEGGWRKVGSAERRG
ncbi:hypothetical protein [Microbacterium sp. 3J1]|uniref:DprA-like winged helix domain-containing protein n=1 Tax=Microbacterium sp. 3J1 TaxID=861269 RepID=UPI002100132B|nr:hypothetical protein [Microbacterium sp. 3J1]